MENSVKRIITQEMLTIDEELEWFVGEIRFEGSKNTILIEGYYLNKPDDPRAVRAGRVALVFRPLANRPDKRPEYEFLAKRAGKPIQLIITSKSLTFISDEDGQQKIQKFETNAEKIRKIKAQLH